MKKISQKELNEMINQHIQWLYDHSTGKRLVLSDVDLSGLNFNSHPYLFNTDLSKSIIMCSNLSGVNLLGINLTNSTFFEVDFSESNFSKANLTKCWFRGSNLQKCDLTDSIIYETIFEGSILSEIKGKDFPLKCPESGSFTGYKKCVTYDNEYCIVELEIPADALRSSSTGNKCRCSKAKVLSITDLKGNVMECDNARSRFDPNFTYSVGSIVEVDDFDTNRWNECAPGIHFFMNREDAVNHIV